MPLQLEIIRAGEFIRAGAKGHFDLEASRQALFAIALACQKRAINSAILDLRAFEPGPEPVFSVADLQELVKTFSLAGFTKALRLAILYRSDPHKRARMFTFLSNLQGWNVRAFGDFEEAVSWLLITEEVCAS